MAEAKEVPASTTEAERTASGVCRLAQRAVDDDRPLFLVVFYRHEGEKLDFLTAVRQRLQERGLQNRTLDPGRNPDHGTGKLYPLLAADGDEVIHLVADLARGEDGAFDPAFLDYLNLHRDRINRETLRWILLLHDSEAEPFLRQAGDLWDFRQRTYWLERPAEPRGEGLWQELGERTERLALSAGDRQEIEEQLATVRQQTEATSDAEDRAGLLLDLARWLRRRYAAGTAVEVALEGLALARGVSRELRMELEEEAGWALYHQRQLGEALQHLQQSLDIRREVGDRAGEAATLNNISQIYRAWGRYDDALQHLQQSLDIRREVGDRAGEATTLNNISQIYDARGQYDDALQHLQQSLDIRREVGDRAGEATTLNNIASIYHAWGRYDDALQHLQQSLDIQREVGDRAGEATTLNNISQIYRAWGRYNDALQHLQQSLKIQREVGDRAGEAATLNNISQIYRAWGRYDDALQHLKQSLEITREVGDRAGEALTSWNLGLEYERQEEWDDAIQHLHRALELEEELDHPDLEADREHVQNLEEKLAARSRV